MACDLDLPVEIVGVPTVREADGLALSSRNLYLSPAERGIAPSLNRIMRDAAAEIAAGAAPAPVLERAIAALSQSGFVVEYLELRDAATLARLASTVRPSRRVCSRRSTSVSRRGSSTMSRSRDCDDPRQRGARPCHLSAVLETQ